MPCCHIRRGNARIGSQIQAVPPRIVDLGNEADVGKGYRIADRIAPGTRFKARFDGRKSGSDPMAVPRRRSPGRRAEIRFELLTYPQIADRVNIAGDCVGNLAAERPLPWIFRQKRRIRVGLVEIGDDGQQDFARGIPCPFARL